MEIMDTARLNIKRKREIKGLRQQDMAEKLSMNTRSYQNLESGATKLDLERLEQIASILETSMEELLRQDGIVINQEIRETATGSGTGNIYLNSGVDKEFVSQLIESKNGEINLLKEENLNLKEELKFLKQKIDQLLDVVEKSKG
jgi:transcriptional regulator with XRE-family HTH domain